MKNTFHVLDYARFSLEFARRLTPPYATEDASSTAQISVLNNLRMAYFNNDQIPIPAGTSVEGAAVHIMRSSLAATEVVSARLASPYPDGVDLRPGSNALSGSVPSPMLVIESDNAFGARLLGFNAAIALPLLTGSLELDDPDGLVVLAFSSEDDDEQTSAIDQAYAEYVQELGKK